MELKNLTDIQEAAAYILNSWTLGLREAQLHGRNSYFDYFRDAYRVHYLYGRIKSACLIDGKIYIGDEEVTLSSISDSYFELWHYRGTWIESGIFGGAVDSEAIGGDIDTENSGIITKPPTDNVDDGGQGGDIEIPLPPTITPDDGTTDSNTGEAGDSTTTTITNNNLNLRVGSQVVAIGSNFVVFFLNGIATPLPNASYVIETYVITSSGRMQRNLVISQQLAGGFQVDDILESGTLYYQVIPIT